MAFVVKDRVKETTTTTGTGTVTLLGAATGFQSFSAIGNGNSTYYTIAGQTGSEWEVGIGTYTSSGTTLSRDTVLASSNSGSLVSFSSGTKDAFVTYPAERSTTTDGDQILTNKTIQSRVVVIADGASITINADTTDIATQANTQAAGTLTVNAPTGTPVNGQKIMLRLLSSNVQTFSWNAVFAGSTDLALPTASSGSSKYDYMGFIYNSTAAKWQIIAKNFGF